MTKLPRSLWLAALLVVSLIAAPAAAAGAPAPTAHGAGVDAPPALGQANESNTTRDADLAIRQPDYAEGDAQRQTADGVPVYTVEGGEILIRPQNFDSADVVDYRVATDGGDLSYDSEFGAYVFHPANNGTGTYDLSWSVRRVENVTTTTNGTTRTDTAVVRSEYTAKLRVNGKTNLQHLTPAESAKRQHYLELGREVNATNQELRDRSLPFIKNTGDDFGIYQAFVDRGVSTGNPYNMLTGSIGVIVITILGTLGGVLLLILNFGGFGTLIYKLKKQLRIFEIVEDEEGDIAERQARLNAKEQQQGAQNVQWHDEIEDDHYAGAFRELGENFHDGVHALTGSQLHPEYWVKDRLLAAGDCGYEVVVERADGDLVDATVVAPEDVPDTDGTEPIAGLVGDGLVAAVDYGDPELKAFDLPSADYDSTELEIEPVTTDLNALCNEVNLQLDDFPNERVAGQYMREYIESVLEHDLTNADGTVNELRDVLNTFLKVAQIGTDKHDLPLQYLAEAIERALIDHDPNEESRNIAQEVRDGA